MKRIGLLVVVFALGVTLGCERREREQTGTYTEPGAIGTAGVRAGDRDFVEDALGAGMAEVELGRLAQNQASSPDVKQFGAMMERDHSQAAAELKRVAGQHGITPPTQLDDRHRDLGDRLSKLRGAEFDREYMKAMVDGHEDMIDLLQTRAREDRFGEGKGTVQPERSDDPVEASLNQWAANALPTTRRHLEEARRISDKLGTRTTQTR